MSAPIQWIETLDLYGTSDFEGLKPEDSAELEKRMYHAALASMKEGYKRLSQLQVPASRRPDYFAEMVKDDKQMTKIRTQLVTAQQKIEAVESRKKKQAQRKFTKQLRAAKIEKKKQEKVDEKLAKISRKPIDKKLDRDVDERKGKKNVSTRNAGKPKQFQGKSGGSFKAKAGKSSFSGKAGKSSFKAKAGKSSFNAKAGKSGFKAGMGKGKGRR